MMQEDLSEQRVVLFKRRQRIASLVSSVLTSVGAVDFAVERNYLSGLFSFLAGAALAWDKQDASTFSTLTALVANLPPIVLYIHTYHTSTQPIATAGEGNGISSFVFALRLASVVLLTKLFFHARQLLKLKEALKREQLKA